MADVPDAALDRLARRPEVAAISLDRDVRGTMERTERSATGARWVTEQLGVDGTGVGIATIDSGVTPWHDDLDGRVAHFADFVNSQSLAYDDYGHGTHVAGIIAGGGQRLGRRRRGMAPGAHLVVLKVLDVTGNGFISNVIAAIDYAIAQPDALQHPRHQPLGRGRRLRVVHQRPLTLAAKRAVEAGIVVVSAAGNLGRGPDGQAAVRRHRVARQCALGDDRRRDGRQRHGRSVATTSSPPSARAARGARRERQARSRRAGRRHRVHGRPGSTLFAAKPLSRLWGTVKTGSEPYLRLSGTSMAAPVVTGAIALMLQANPPLTPNAVKAILEYTAEARDGYDTLTQGAGFLNARGAVELARAFSGTGLGPELRAIRCAGAGTSSGAIAGSRWHARRPRQRVETRRDVGRRADARRPGDHLGRGLPRRRDGLRAVSVDGALQRCHAGL